MILLLGGTSDTHDYLAAADTVDIIISVATDYGYKLFSEKYPHLKVIKTRFTEDALCDFLELNNITLVVDTTHPYAVEITKTAINVCSVLNIRYLDKMRTMAYEHSYEKMSFHVSWRDALEYIQKNNLLPALFTIGSKHLHEFKPVLNNSVVRVLDSEDSVNTALELGVVKDRIIAAKGPFSHEENLNAVIKASAKCIVSKMSGKKGGFSEKVSAAQSAGIEIVVINC